MDRQNTDAELEKDHNESEESEESDESSSTNSELVTRKKGKNGQIKLEISPPDQRLCKAEKRARKFAKKNEVCTLNLT